MNDHADGAVDVVVIGGGIAGLAAANRAVNAGASVLVIEASDKIGGVMKTEMVNGFLVEHGPTSMGGSPATVKLLGELGLVSQMVTPAADAKRRYVVRNDAMHALPSSPPAMLRSGLLSASAKARLLAEPFVPRGSAQAAESLAALVERRFGKEVLDYVVDPFVSGVCGGDATRLSKRFTLRTLDELEQQYGSVLLGAIKRARSGSAAGSPHIVSFRDGMQQLPEALCRTIESAHHGTVRTNARVTRVSRTDMSWEIRYEANRQVCAVEAGAVVCALPAHALNQVLWPEGWAASLRQVSAVRYAPIATVALGFRRSQVSHALDGFGVLIPSVEKRRILGALFNSSMFANRAPADHCLVTAFVGGSRMRAVPSESEAIDAAVSELTILLGIRGAPVMTSVERWDAGIPQLELGHEIVQMAASNIAIQSTNAFFTGSYLSGVAIGDCLAHGSETGDRAAVAALRSRKESCNILARMSDDRL